MTTSLSLRDKVGVVWALEKAAIRGQLEYRTNFFLMAMLGILYQGSGFAFIWITLSQFGTIAGWSFTDVAFLYSLRLVAHVVWVVPFNQLHLLSGIVREGKLDRMLVRPLNPLLQVMTNRVQINVVGDVLIAAALFVTTVRMVDIDFTVPTVTYLIVSVIGGALAEGAVVLAVSSLCFRLVDVWALEHMLDNVYLMFGSYPIKLFGVVAARVLTWVVPVAFVAYIPASFLLGKTAESGVPTLVALIAPLVGVGLFLLAYGLWINQLRGYQGVGN